MKAIIIITLFIGSLLSVNGSSAQEKTHTVAPKENYYSIGRLYNVPPKQIAAYNNLNMDAGLQIGQKLRIPGGGQATSVAVTTTTTTTSTIEKAEALNHVVVQGDNLYRISKTYNVSISDIKQWNNMTSDDVKLGQTLVINKKGAQPAVARTETQPAVAVNKAPEVTTTPKKAPEDSALIIVSPVQTKPAPSTKEDESEKAVSIRGGSSQPTKQAPAEEVKEAPVKAQPASSTKTETKSADASYSESTAPAEGAFSLAFSKGNKASSLNGEAATFKSTSGWQDRKYYVLINDVSPGTIVKISAADKVVYAKVLGNMPEMKENNGILLRLSNSAASHLGIVDPRFPVQVTYYQ